MPQIRWVGTAEAAARLGLTQMQVRELVISGQLPATRTGTNATYGRFRIREDDLEAYKRAQEGQADEPLPSRRLDQRGLVMCPWSCGQPVRRMITPRARYIYVNPEPDVRGIITAYWDGSLWRARQLHKGEGPAPHERRWLIHQATCWRVARANGRPARPPRLKPVPPPPGPMPRELRDETRRELEKIRRRRREET